MVRQFYRASLALDAASADVKSGRLKLLLVFFVHAVVAVVLLGVIFAAANGMKPRPGHDFQAFFAGGLRAAFAAIRQQSRVRANSMPRSIPAKLL